MTNVTDIEGVVLDWAWNNFTKTREDRFKKLKLDDVQMTVNWSRVRFQPNMPEYSDATMVDKPNSKIVFTSTFENNTDSEQEHSFATERTTACTATTSISKGYTKGFHVELKLALPEEVASATAGFGREVNVDSTDESTQETSITWSVDSNIKVPPKHKTIAKMVVKEKEFNGTFKMSVSVSGRVIVSFANLKDNNNFIHSCEGDISEVLGKNTGKSGYKIEGKKAIFAVEGKTAFRFGVEQRVKIDQEKLSG